MPCCEISDYAQMSKTIAVMRFGLGGRESLKTAETVCVKVVQTSSVNTTYNIVMLQLACRQTSCNLFAC